MKKEKVIRSKRNRAPIASPDSTKLQGLESTDPSPTLAFGAVDQGSGATPGSIAAEVGTGGAPAMDLALPAADDRPHEVDVDKEYAKFIKKGRAALQALEGREREVRGMDPDYAQEVETLERLEAMTHKLLVRMRARKRGFDKSLRELRVMLDQRDDFASTWMG